MIPANPTSYNARSASRSRRFGRRLPGDGWRGVPDVRWLSGALVADGRAGPSALPWMRARQRESRAIDLTPDVPARKSEIVLPDSIGRSLMELCPAESRETRRDLGVNRLSPSPSSIGTSGSRWPQTRRQLAWPQPSRPVGFAERYLRRPVSRSPRGLRVRRRGRGRQELRGTTTGGGIGRVGELVECRG